jgi:hypothetical protein
MGSILFARRVRQGLRAWETSFERLVESMATELPPSQRASA